MEAIDATQPIRRRGRVAPSAFHYMAIAHSALHTAGILAFFLVTGCNGFLRGGDDNKDRSNKADQDANAGPNGNGVDPNLPSTLRRLTKREYQNVIQSVFTGASFTADIATLTAGVVDDTSYTGFDNVAHLQAIDYLRVDGYKSSAKAIATAFADALATNASYRNTWQATCATTAADEACGHAVATALGRKLYRRSLSDTEIARATTLFSAGTDGRDAIARLTEAMLQSPNFLYKIEVGDTSQTANGKIPLTSPEIASRLSFLLWEDAPDEALMTAAENGSLATAEGLRAEMKRMLQDPRTKTTMRRFVEQWFLLTRLNTTYVHYSDTTRYPVTENLLSAMRTELYKNVDDAIWNSPDFFTLYTSKTTRINNTLASQVYKISAPQALDSEGFGAVDLTADGNRGGLFSLPAFLTTTAYHDEPSVIFRGKFVRFYALCDEVPPPPAGIAQTTPEAQDENRRMTDPVCSACHTRLDPIGDGLRRFDALGRLDTTLPGADKSGVIHGVSETTFEGAHALGTMVRSTPMAASCLAQKWIQWATGGVDTTGEGATAAKESLAQSFTASGNQFQSLIDAWVQSDMFRTKDAN